MKFKVLAFAFCAMSLAAQDISELYAKAGEYEAKGDYKNAMIYYKRIAAASLAERGEKSRRKVAEILPRPQKTALRTMMPPFYALRRRKIL